MQSKSLMSLLLSSLFLISCAKSSSDYPIVTFNDTDVKELFSIYSIDHEIQLEGMIGLNDDYTKMIIFDSDYYIFTRSDQKVHRFNRNGAKVTEYGNLGGGPGEYIVADDFLIDINNGNIEILSDISKKIFIYDSESNFLESKPIIGNPYQFAKLNDGTYIFAKGPVRDSVNNLNTAQIYRTDGVGNILDKSLEVENNALIHPMPDNSIQYSNGRYYYKYWFSTYVYDITDKEPVIVAEVDFGGRNLNEKMLRDGNSMDDLMNFMMELGDFYVINRYLENDSFIYLYITGEKSYHLIYDKKTGKTDTFPGSTELSRVRGALHLTKDNKLIFLEEKDESNFIIQIDLLGKRGVSL